MATVVRETYEPALDRRDSGFGDFLLQLLAQKRRDERLIELEQAQQERKAASAGRAANVLNELLGTAPGIPEGGFAGATGVVNRVTGSPSERLTKSIVEGGGNTGTGLEILSGIQDLKRTQAEEAKANIALSALGERIREGGDERSAFAADVLIAEDVPIGTKVAILSQVGNLFPEDSKTKFKDVTVYTKDGRERVLRVPDDVGDPQKYIEENYPGVIEAGFTTTKPRLAPQATPRHPTETERDVETVVRTDPILSNIEDQQIAQDRARIIIRNMPEVLNQLEADFKVETSQGFFGFASEKDQILFEMSRSNAQEIMAGGQTDIGKAVKEAERRARVQFENLEFLPDSLAVRMPRQGESGQQYLANLANTVRYLIREDEAGDTIVGGDTIEDSFNNAIALIKRQIDLTDEHVAFIREIVMPSNKGNSSSKSTGSLSFFE